MQRKNNCTIFFMLRKERTAHHPSVLIAPAYGLIPLQLADVLVVAGVVFAIRSVSTLRHEHTHTVELLASHLEVSVEEAPALACEPLLSKALLDDGTVERLFPQAIILSRQLREEEVAGIEEHSILLVELLFSVVAVVVVYQSFRIGIAVANLVLHDVEGRTCGTGQLVHLACLHHHEGQGAIARKPRDIPPTNSNSPCSFLRQGLLYFFASVSRNSAWRKAYRRRPRALTMAR